MPAACGDRFRRGLERRGQVRGAWPVWVFKWCFPLLCSCLRDTLADCGLAFHKHVISHGSQGVPMNDHCFCFETDACVLCSDAHDEAAWPQSNTSERTAAVAVAGSAVRSVVSHLFI